MKIMSGKQFCVYLGIGPTTLNRWVKEGWVKPVLIGKVKRYTEESLVVKKPD